jgi:hypothetical protein
MERLVNNWGRNGLNVLDPKIKAFAGKYQPMIRLIVQLVKI